MLFFFFFSKIELCQEDDTESFNTLGKMSLPVTSLTRIGTTTELGLWGMKERGREAESIYSQILLGSLQLYKAPSQLALPSLPRTKNATVSAHSTNPSEGTMIISRSEVSGIFLC